ncbi:putative glycosyltransferase EpsD [Clostridium polyendosporum]|uniref:Glycosyltransferase EpsD n=1 Tax=Clostridium polyendosporum TaxID=69208 RepID=A0A919VFT5_9CLOT|nr:glycosyltransferase family 4 protein [Clostridium polyendosporum]GIM28755.1 putative glycosyltransferase EpsD [Clostridium polyendosporum]
MSKKILYCATVDNHFMAFHLPYMKWFQEQGWEVHVAAKGDIDLPYCDKKYNIPIERSPLNLSNFKACKEIKKIIYNNQYSIIHCHTPMGGVLARLAAKAARNKGTKVFYTAHGFHFCKGAPLLNWILYYPLERWLARYTDCLITINNEDYNLAVNHHFRAKKIERIHGVGVDTEKFKPVSKSEQDMLREKHGYKTDDFLLYYVAELNKNKNQQLLIKVISKVRKEIPNVHLLLVGEGNLMNFYKSLTKELNIDDIVDFLGFRKDVDEISKMSDVAVASSLREGLPVNIMEAMACGKPVIATNNRGHRELVVDGLNGWLVSNNSTYLMSEYIINLKRSRDLIKSIEKNAREYILDTYDINSVMNEMTNLYIKFMGGM